MKNILENMSRWTRMLVGLLLLTIIGWIDYYTGKEMAFSIFYLIPVFVIVWFSGKRDGIAIALLGSVVWLVVDVFGGSGHTFYGIDIWNGFVRFGFFVIFVFLTSNLKKLNNELELKVIERTEDLTAEISERRKTERELKNITAKLRQLTKRIQVIKEEENKVIAREIHDELGQALTAIKIDVAWLSKKYANEKTIVDGLYAVSKTVDETIKTVRKISTRLRPRLLDELGLIPAIEWQARELQSKTGIKCRLSLPEEKINISSTASSIIFRIFQEAATNIARHAKAKNVEVEVLIRNNELKMIVKDDGTGLPEDYLAKENSLGILGMQERADSIGGKLELKSKKDEGTEVRFSAPLRKKELIMQKI